MLRWITLLLPALIPSWRFFQTIEPSPRIEYRLPGGAWRPARPVPDRVPLVGMAGRLFWNPSRNEALFMTSLAERIIAEDRNHARREVLSRLAGSSIDETALQFRLVTVRRVGTNLEYQVAYLWPPDQAMAA